MTHAPALLDAAAICREFVPVNRKTWTRWTAERRTPASITIGLGRRPRRFWRRADIELWTEHGCEPRDRFEMRLRLQQQRRPRRSA